MCQAEYGGTQQLHHAAKNYVHNYGISAGLHQNRCIPYKRALRNLVVLMFSHYVNHLECTGSLEGHRTLMVYECLVVAAALGRYHRWQRRASHQDRDTYDWTKVPVVPKDDFQHKYSPALDLLGNAQNPAYAHPKLLGHCFDNVYFCGRIIGDLPERGRPPHSVERTKLIYDQEYKELVHRLENTLDLTLKSPSYSMVPDVSCKPGHCPLASRVPEAPWTSGTAIGPRARTEGIQHGWGEGIGRSRLVPADPYLSPR